MSTQLVVPEELMRLKNGAKELSISRWSMRRMCVEGKVSYHRIGKLILVPRSEVERIFRESRVK